ncbi:MAG: OmpH family outer membrane protein [Lentisphaeria bacterium]|nr:OmpH family outer membrane protein [Lentisphaeria bacterium]
MKKAFVLLAALVAVTVSAASPRIAVVDLRRVFKEYYKSRIAEEFIKQQAESARLYLGQLTKQLEALRADARRLGTNAMNQALDPALKAKADADAAAALRKVAEKEAEIKLYTGERAREIQELEQRRRAEIIADIRAEINRRAVVGGYELVLDSSGMTTNDLPAVLVFSAKNDISNAVIRELNRNASKPKSQR